MLTSPFYHLIERARGGEGNPWMRRRLETGASSAIPPSSRSSSRGRDGLPRPPLRLRQRQRALARVGHRLLLRHRSQRRVHRRRCDAARRPRSRALSLAMKAVRHTIPRDCWAPISARDAGRRVHAGAVERGSVDICMRCSGMPISAASPDLRRRAGSVVIEMLNEVFETLTAALRPRGGQVLKFLGDGMLATFSFEEDDRAQTCHRALDAAAEAWAISRRSMSRGRRRPARRAGRSRASPGRRALRQRRRQRPARLHRHRPAVTKWRASRPCANRSAARCWSRPSSRGGRGRRQPP